MKKSFLILLFCIFPLLSACVAAAVGGAAVGGATLGGAVIYDKRSMKTMNHDHLATQYAQHYIDHSKILKGRSHIAVTTFNHTLLMVGQAQTPALKQYAYNLIKNKVQSIKRLQLKRIYNEVKIAGSNSFMQRTSDSWLTTKVKTALVGTKHLHSSQIKVVTEDRTVYLMGLVSRKEAQLATNTARRVSGVRRVVKVFEYT